ncbi:hypothetical protein BCV72DRAFT_334919 [Rhizopus microsporus var. microsporus]|nr:hypothetical protein BCV72DRAFT_334919 [Rhizopus microsporus var. microsporus]
MENKNELEYQEKLNVLERQRESLELMMQKMDEEWEESGTGIGWISSDIVQQQQQYLHSLLNANDQTVAKASLVSPLAHSTELPTSQSDKDKKKT